ncbi:MAG: hypothetical protein E6G45_09190 [Actinobacteria bacterium]|nr:MAG: hypothetical protein E6G45_09190 [Actinomycetota bacterium]
MTTARAPVTPKSSSQNPTASAASVSANCEVVGDQAPLPEQEVLEQGRDERRRDARQRDHKSRPSEPFEQAGRDGLDHGSDAHEDDPQAGAEPERVRHQLRTVGGLPCSEIGIRSGQPEAAEVDQDQRQAERDREDPLTRRAQLARHEDDDEQADEERRPFAAEGQKDVSAETRGAPLFHPRDARRRV